MTKEIIHDENTKKISLDDLIQKYESEFVSVIRKRLGIVVKHQMREMYKTIYQACHKFNCDPYTYLQNIRVCEDNSPLLEYLVLGITIGETYFFRDKNQMKLLQEQILPEIIRKKRVENNLNIRIWSAGCSSGEEIYSIMMLLAECLADTEKWTLKLIGTDINTRVINKAMAASYGEWSMRSITDYYKKKYFKHEEGEYKLSDSIKKHVNFFYLNLNDDTYPSMLNETNSQDLILCRNVLIYFDQDNTSSIMKKLYASLVPGGWLLLGASDPINMAEMSSMYLYNNSAFSKRSEPGVETHKPQIKDNIPANIKVSLPFSPAQAAKPHTQTQIQSKINKQSSFNENLTRLINDFRWQEVIKVIQGNELIYGKSADLLHKKAMAYANLGLLENAMIHCRESLSLDPTNKFTYLTYALILSELNKLNEAEAALRKTLFLDHKFIVGHFQLGLLLLRNKSKDRGLKCLYNALHIASNANAKHIVPGSQGITCGQFTEILKHEIDIYELGSHAYVNRNT